MRSRRLLKKTNTDSSDVSHPTACPTWRKIEKNGASVLLLLQQLQMVDWRIHYTPPELSQPVQETMQRSGT